MKIVVYPRQKIIDALNADINAFAGFVAISINDFAGAFDNPNEDGSQRSPFIAPSGAVLAKGLNGLLSLNFDDTTEDQWPWRMFDIEQAKKVKEFIDNIPNCPDIIIHCRAGVSRSAAMGIALNEYLNQNNEEDFKDNELNMFPFTTPFPNPIVLNCLRRVFGLSYSE